MKHATRFEYGRFLVWCFIMVCLVILLVCSITSPAFAGDPDGPSVAIPLDTSVAPKDDAADDVAARIKIVVDPNQENAGATESIEEDTVPLLEAASQQCRVHEAIGAGTLITLLYSCGVIMCRSSYLRYLENMEIELSDHEVLNKEAVARARRALLYEELWPDPSE